MSDEKTEEPSAKKLEKAREEGQVAKSSDLVEAASLGAVIVMLLSGEHYLAGTLRAIVKEALDFVSGGRSTQDMAVVIGDIGTQVAHLICGIAAITLGAAILA
ncbi:MAG: type secretion protein, partial [Paraburkholderia sp.]|nr:type secretion protein [Paraburkholderia sp.]